MIQKLLIRVVFNNICLDTNLTPAWGFSAWIRTDSTEILFDTGSSGEILLDNLADTGLDPGDLDLVVISHPHWDHTDGLKAVSELVEIPVFIPVSAEMEMREEFPGIDLRTVEKGLSLAANVYSSGEMKGDHLGREIPEQALILDSSYGLIIITGCAHPGIETMLLSIREQFPQRPIYLVTGGFHLSNETRFRIEECLGLLKKLKVKYLAPSHCSGNLALEMVRKSWDEHCPDLSLGKKFELI